MYFSVILLIAAFATGERFNVAAGRRKDILKVVTVLNAPYVSVVDERKSEGIANRTNISDDIEGYAVDLLNELAKEANIQFEIRLVPDGRYGAFDSNNNWNGMIGEVLNERADLAIADLTVTKKREEFVDFSYPFMTTGIGLLVKRPPYFDTDEENKNRTLLVYPVSSINDLPFQNQVDFGAVKSGSTYSFFTHSDNAIYKLIGERMAANQSMLSISIREASERVKNSNGRYAFFMESASIEYKTGKSCDFMKLGEDIHSRSYAIAMRKNYPLKTRINIGLLALQEKGVLDQLKSKWFGQVQTCDDYVSAPYTRNILNLVLRSIK